MSAKEQLEQIEVQLKCIRTSLSDIYGRLGKTVGVERFEHKLRVLEADTVHMLTSTERDQAQHLKELEDRVRVCEAAADVDAWRKKQRKADYWCCLEEL